MNKLKGVVWGMLSGASFGLIPLFTLPLLGAGLSIDTLLFYRFGTAALIIGAILLVRKENFRITKSQAWRLSLLGVLYMSSAIFLLLGYSYMAAGVATAVHFLYPVCVVVLMMLFFGERASLSNIGAMILAVLGVALIGSGEGGSNGQSSISTLGLVVVVISSIAYALYIIGIKKLKLTKINGLKLTFYVLSTTALLFLCKSLIFGNGLEPIEGATNIANVVMLAIIPTIIANLALVEAIKMVGSSSASILGALEPMTAVTVGVFAFDEPINAILVIGVALIIGAVATIVLRKA